MGDCLLCDGIYNHILDVTIFSIIHKAPIVNEPCGWQRQGPSGRISNVVEIIGVATGVRHVLKLCDKSRIEREDVLVCLETVFDEDQNTHTEFRWRIIPEQSEEQVFVTARGTSLWSGQQSKFP